MVAEDSNASPARPKRGSHGARNRRRKGRRGGGQRQEAVPVDPPRARIEPVALYADPDPRGGIQVTLPENLRQNRPLMLWLHHRVVDLLADNGLLDFLFHDVEERLALLSTDITSDYIGALLDEGQRVVQPPEQDAEETAV